MDLLEQTDSHTDNVTLLYYYSACKSRELLKYPFCWQVELESEEEEEEEGKMGMEEEKRQRICYF